MKTSLTHLDPQLRDLAGKDATARIRMVSKDLFIEHEHSQYLNDILDTFLSEPRHGRMPCWLIAGDSGMGKSAQLRRFTRRYPDHHAGNGPTLVRPIVIIDLPPEPTLRTTEIEILEVLKAPVITHSSRVNRGAVIRRLLAAHNTRILVFDEVQHVCHSGSRDRAVVLDHIKSLSTTCQLRFSRRACFEGMAKLTIGETIPQFAEVMTDRHLTISEIVRQRNLSEGASD